MRLRQSAWPLPRAVPRRGESPKCLDLLSACGARKPGARGRWRLEGLWADAQARKNIPHENFEDRSAEGFRMSSSWTWVSRSYHRATCIRLLATGRPRSSSAPRRRHRGARGRPRRHAPDSDCSNEGSKFAIYNIAQKNKLGTIILNQVYDIVWHDMTRHSGLGCDG